MRQITTIISVGLLDRDGNDVLPYLPNVEASAQAVIESVKGVISLANAVGPRVDFVFAGQGVGVWEGEREPAVTVIGVTKVADLDTYRQNLETAVSILAARWRQEAIALTIIDSAETAFVTPA